MLANINSTEASYNIRESERIANVKSADKVEKEISAVNNNKEDKLELSVAASKKFDALKPAPLPGTNYEPKADPAKLAGAKGSMVDSKA
jgi:hypothetical protein